MFEDLGWSHEGMTAVAAAEVVGGLMLGLRSTRRVGGGGVGRDERDGAGERGEASPDASWRGRAGFLLAAALIALVAPGRA